MNRAERKRLARRRVKDGFPVETPFSSLEEVREYLSGDRIICLRCGRSQKALGTHLLRIHGITADQYREMYGLLYSEGVVSAATRDNYSHHAKVMAVERREELLDNIDRGHITRERNREGGRKPRYGKLERLRRAGQKIFLSRWRDDQDALRPERMNQFLKRLSEVGVTGVVCREPGMPTISCVRAWVEAYPEFKERYEKLCGAFDFQILLARQRLPFKFSQECLTMFQGGMNKKSIALKVGVSEMTVARHIKRAQGV